MTALAEGSKDATGGSAGAALNGNNTRGKGSGRSSASASVAAAPQKPHHRTAMLRAAEKKRASDAQFLGRETQKPDGGFTAVLVHVQARRAFQRGGPSGQRHPLERQRPR